MKDLLNEALGADFEVIKLAGQGRQAEVYLARELSLDRLVAVKVLLSAHAENSVAKARFEREAKAAASLNHPNVASIFRFGFLPNHIPFLVLQYVRGRTLAERISAEGPLPVPEGRRILRDLSRALRAAHNHGFVHRDVRPGNVMCDLETKRTLLTDFGVARILPTGQDQGPRLTQTGELLGDIKHMSPEQIAGEDATGAADIYALGVLGYEILTGRGPFPDLPISGMIAAHLRATPQPLSDLVDHGDPELAALLDRCLAKDPAQRPSAEFVAEVLEGPPAGKAPPPAREVHDESAHFMKSLMKRRFPQVVVVTGGVGYAWMEIMSQFVEMGLFEVIWYHLTLATVIAGVSAASVVAWFHGAKGKQKVGVLEVLLLSTISVLWILGCAFILLRG
jgi:serine/threonine protein kinase